MGGHERSESLVRFAETRVSKLNVRRHASQNSEHIATIQDEGTPLIILDESYASDKVLWYHIVTWNTLQVDGTFGITLGWVRSDLVALMNVDDFMHRYQYWTPSEPTVRPPSHTAPAPTRKPVPVEPPIFVFTPVPVEAPIFVFPSPK